MTQIPYKVVCKYLHRWFSGLSWSGADNNTVRTYNGTSYTFFYFTDAQAETTTGEDGGGQGNQNNKFFIGTDPTLTPQQTEALNKIHGVEMLLLGAGGSGGTPGNMRGDSNIQGIGGGGGGAGGMGELHDGNLPTNQYIKFLMDRRVQQEYTEAGTNMRIEGGIVAIAQEERRRMQELEIALCK